jgi:menaquinone-dependent protoporphyrinogen IX oxidase
MSQTVNKVLVMYKSKYGSTKRYARWIAEEVKADLKDSSEMKAEDLQKYDTIVFGGSLHAVGIKGVRFITDNFEKIRDKKVIVYGVGATPWREGDIMKVYDANFKEGIRERINFFYFRGAFDYDKLSVGDKTLMTLLKLKLQSKKEEDRDEDVKGLLACYDNPADWTDKDAIRPLVECIKTNN